MAHCDESLEHISAAIDGALSPQEQEELKAHLSACPDCQKLYDDLAALHAAMAQMPPVEVPAGLKSRIMDAVAAETENTKVLPFAPKKASRHWQRWLASAAVLALIVMGTWSWKPWEAQKPEVNALSSNGITADRGMDASAAGAADGASPAAVAPQTSPVQVSVVPELASAPMVASPGAAAAEAPMEKSAVRFAKEAPSSENETVSGDPSAPQVTDASVTEDLPIDQAAPAGESSPLQVPAEAPASQVAPRLFSAPAPSGAEDSQPTAAPRMFAAAIPTPAEEWSLEQSVTSQEQAVNVLANYIYEFVDTVEPAADVPDVYAISSPTGVSGTVTCLGEFEPAFLLDYQESLSTEVFHYSVSRSTGEVFLLGQEELPDQP